MVRPSLMLTDGTLDDQVQLQMSIQLTNALVKTEKRYTVVIHSGHAYGVCADFHRHTVMTKFILKNLQD